MLYPANSFSGIDICGNGLTGANGNLIEGNYIGTNAAGTCPLGNGCQGIHITDASDNTIGGSATGAATSSPPTAATVS